MIRDEVWRRLAVPPRRLTVNETVLLDGDTRVRFVETGAIAVYCVEVEEDEVAGPRRFLTKFGAGQGVFSANLERPNGLRLMFVPTEETVVREVELEALWADAKNHGTTLGPLVDGWVRFLTDGIGGPEAPTLSTKLDADTELTLEEGEVLAAGSDDVRWVKMVDGTLHCFGAENLALLPNQAYFPVAGPIWVRSVGATRTAVRRSESLGDWRQLSDGIWRLHSLALAFLQSKLRQEAKAELERLEERERTQARRTEEALETLAAVLDPKSARARREARDLDPLLAVMMLVGEAVGVEIRPPRVSESAGSGVDPIEAIARASQIRTRRVTLNAEWWKSDCGPILGFSADGQRPLALIRERSGYRVHDPIDRTWRKVDAKVAAEMLPEGVTVYRRLPEGPVDLLGLLKFAARGRGRDLVMVLLIGMGATVLGMIVPIAMRLLMDQAIPDADRRLLMEIGGGLLAVAVGQVLFQLAQGLYMIRVQFSSEADTQAAVWDRLLRLRPAFFRNFSSGDLQSRVMAVDAIGNAISGVALSSLFSGFLALMNLGLLYYYSAQLSLIAVGIAALVAAVTIVVSYFIRANTRELLDIQGLRYGLEVQLISGVGKLRVGGAGGRAFNHWMKSYSRQMGLWAKNFQLRDGVTLFNQLIPTASSILLFYFAHELLSQGRSGEGGMTLGVFLAFSAAYGTFLSGTTRLTGTIVSLMDTLVKARRLEPILSAEPEIDTEKSDPGRLTGEMAVTDAFFRYEEDGPDILRGVTFRAEPGEFVAIVGPSGSGKSTLMRLLLGFEAPQSGSVTFDHQDLVSLDVLAVRRQLGVVLQGGKLDAGTVFENISSGNVITLDQAWAAAEDAGLADDVRDMPMGMHTIISVGGDNLSGGQRQRLLIARALVQRPKILLFDEATSALDNRTQAIVSESLERLNVTRIVIAHRLSTIRNADRIYVVEAGRAVQSGRFDELIEDDDGLFARMMKRQMA